MAFIFSTLTAFSIQVNVEIYAQQEKTAVSPYIYGRNNCFSNVSGSPTSAGEIALYKDAGLRFARENNGNNATKYNWKKKISSHPDWYNNVYDHDWDYAASTIEKQMPGLQTMWAFQLIGKVADNKINNFNDWNYNQSKWWSGVNQNLAGGGVVNQNGGSKATKDGNPDLYLKNWNADSTTAILNHWFSPGGLGLKVQNNLYWSMDNEPEIWNGTHDDIMPSLLSANDFMSKYFDVAKKARAKNPNIKLCGPVVANEWQWYKWGGETLKINGINYCWLEYFIKRVADEQKASGIKLLDMVDIHWYPSETADAEVLQLHRIFYDINYDYPGANGLFTIYGGWDINQKKEYIFKRINDWLDKHFGKDHGIETGMTECDLKGSNPNITSVLYASVLGTFAKNGVDVFTPWSWNTGMWETMHLFSRYSKNFSIKSTSSYETAVSAYSTVNGNADSMTVILVNRDLTNTHTAVVNINEISVGNNSYNTYRISGLPGTETFKSHYNNALKTASVSVAKNTFSLVLPALSTTAVVLYNSASAINNTKNNYRPAIRYERVLNELRISNENLFNDNPYLEITDLSGKVIKKLFLKTVNENELCVRLDFLKPGFYIARYRDNYAEASMKFIKD